MIMKHKDNHETRPIRFECGYTKHANGSVLASFGDTKVLCTVMCEEGVPNFVQGKDQGWLTAEYSMLPGSTIIRKKRRTISGENDGRTVEIQRFIGRCLRNCIDLKLLGEYTLYVDCDVLQADGGTRTAAISGAYLALRLAIDDLLDKGFLHVNPLVRHIAAVSVGKVDGELVLDLCFQEDSRAEVDLNVVMDHEGHFIEVQGNGEKRVFSRAELDQMLDVAGKGIKGILEIMEEQFEANRRSYAECW